MITPGSIVGNVKIGRLLGRGAMGEVYSGEQVSLRRPCAIKRIASHLADDEDIIHRFAREAQVVALINSPHVVGVYEFGKFTDGDGEEHYLIVMELVDGGFDLKSCVGSEITWQQSCSIIMQVAEGLAAAAEHDVIHRDIKPDNIMLSKKGVAKLADFGLAKSVDSTAMTMQGTLMGTPNYMPPEACRGEEVDARGDMYSLGATWYHLMSGQSLFTAANTMALLRAHCDDVPKSISECVPDLPAEVAALLMSCVAKDPADRPQSADDLYKELCKIDGVPQKVPELIRLIKPTDSESSGTDSTMATIPAGAGASATAATIVTGQYANNSNEDETFVAEKDYAQPSDPHRNAQAKVADPDATIANTSQVKNGLTETATAIENENTLMPSTSSTEKMQPTNKSSAMPMIVGGVLVVAAAVGGFMAMSAGPAAKEVADQKSPTHNTAVTPTTHVADQQTAQVDLVPLLAVCTAALAQKDYVKAAAAYKDVAAHSDAHQDMQTSIHEGLAAQETASASLTAAMATDDIAELGKTLNAAKPYPALRKPVADAEKKLSSMQQALADAELKVKEDAALKVAVATCAASIKAKEFTRAQGEYKEVLVLSDQQTALSEEIKQGLALQEKQLTQLEKDVQGKDIQALESTLASARSYPELSEKIKPFTASLEQLKKDHVQLLRAAVDQAIVAKSMSAAKLAFKDLVSAVGEEELVLQKIRAAEAQQKLIADAMKKHQADGHYVLLGGDLPAAKQWVDLQAIAAQHEKNIAAKSSEILKALKSVPGFIQGQKWKKASDTLDGIGVDPLAIGKTAVGFAQGQRASLKDAAAAEYNRVVEVAIASIGEPKKAKEYLMGCKEAAGIAGLEKHWQAKLDIVNNIINGNN
ncbi:MAG: protein kinase [Planctomycetes bacterium]|nr:protein kinase [Planctomycetota bacterium]